MINLLYTKNRWQKIDDIKHVLDILECTYNNDKEYIRKLDLLQNKIFELNLEVYVCKNN